MNEKSVIMTLISIILILSMIGTIGSSMMFTKGFHNMDLGHNINYVNAEFNLNLLDVDSDYNVRTSNELYILGVNQIFKGFGLMIFFTIIFMTSLFLINIRGMGK